MVRRPGPGGSGVVVCNSGTITASWRLPPSSFPSTSILLGVLVTAGGVIGLAATNPGPVEFREFAAEQLTRLITEEICREDGLPLMLRLVIRDCPAVVDSQRQVLGNLALEHSRRRNLGLFSLYVTELGGERILLNWSLPRYHALTLAAAGRFVLLRTGQDNGSSRAERP
jgi:hypothetical protein